MAQASLRSRTLHLEGVGPLPAVRLPLDHQLQLAGSGPPAVVIAAWDRSPISCQGPVSSESGISSQRTGIPCCRPPWNQFIAVYPPSFGLPDPKNTDFTDENYVAASATGSGCLERQRLYTTRNRSPGQYRPRQRQSGVTKGNIKAGSAVSRQRLKPLMLLGNVDIQ